MRLILISFFIVLTLFAEQYEEVKISAGEFLMGTKKGRPNEQPQHRVKIGYDFYMGKHEVTVGEYQECVLEQKCRPPLKNSYFEKMCQKDDCPVINVSWDDAHDYAEWFSNKTGKKFRLPSEAEWEYAARAGTTTAYSFGNTAENLFDYAWFGQINGFTTKAVKLKKPNPWGLYDIHGGVWEWCEDSYTDNYNHAPNDGSPYREGNLKVIRGGSWYCPFHYLRSAFRFSSDKSSRNIKTGFRLVRDL